MTLILISTDPYTHYCEGTELFYNSFNMVTVNVTICYLATISYKFNLTALKTVTHILHSLTLPKKEYSKKKKKLEKIVYGYNC